MTELLSAQGLEDRLREIGATRYHNLHPFHGLLHGGKLDKGQVQAWALNRYCYQAGIPRKDAALMSRLTDRELRREWLHRILDHDGFGDDPGGIERWLILTEGLGLDRDYVMSMEGALPATRMAVESYVRFVAERPTLDDAAALGCHLHGAAGDLAADGLGMHGMIATDIIDYLPIAFIEYATGEPSDDDHFEG